MSNSEKLSKLGQAIGSTATSEQMSIDDTGVHVATQAADDNSTKIATTEYVDRLALSSVPVGNRVLIETKIASSSPFIHFNHNATIAIFDDYEIEIVNYEPSSEGEDLLMQVSKDSSGATVETTAQYNYSLQRWLSDGLTGHTAGALANSFALALDVGKLTAGEGADGQVKYKGAHNTTTFKRFSSEFVSTDVDGKSNHFIFGGTHHAASVIYGVRFVPSAGTIAQGTFRLYGIKK